MYPSTTMTQASSKQGYGMVPKGFTVRVYKGPSVYSFPETAPSHFNRGYQSVPLTEPRQSSSNQVWYPRAQPTALAPSEPQKTSRPSAGSGSSLSTQTDTRLLTYDPHSRSKPPSYSIYQSSNDTFIYEASLSSKADLSSNSEDEGATTPDYINSAFSPAMSTDSITTVRGNTPDASLTDLRTSASAPAPASSSSRISFPLYIPGFAQAQTAIKGIFRNQTQNDSQSIVNTSFASRATSASSSSSPARPSAVTPIRASVTAVRSGERDTDNSANQHASTSNNAPGLRSPIPDDEDSEMDVIAKANAEYNAAASRAVPYYPSVRDSMHPPAVNSAASGTGLREATDELHTNLPLRSSPERYHAQSTTPHVQPLYRGASEMTGPQSVENNSSTRLLSVASIAQIPPPQNGGPSGRYVPASQTMTPGSILGTSPELKTNQERHEQNGSSYSVVRERKNSVSRVSPTISASHVYHEGGGAGTNRSASSADESRRGSVERQASYASYRADVPYRADAPVIHETTTLRTAPHQVYTAPSTHYSTPIVQSNCDTAPDVNSRYMASMTTRPLGSAISHTSDHRASPQQAYMYPSPHQSASHSRAYSVAPSSGETPSNLVSSASTRVTNTSPPRIRRDSFAARPNGPSTNPTNAAVSNTHTQAQGQPQQNRDNNLLLRQSPDYENSRGKEFGPRLETERAKGDPYSRISERQAALVSNTFSQRVPATNVTPSSSARTHPETPAHTAAVPGLPQTPFPVPLCEPQRRYSDGDSSVASHSTHGPAYAASSSANVPPTRAGTSTVTEAPRTTEPQPQRRYSDGESNIPDRTSLSLFRTVRWNENLICPSPIFAHQRRKGWFNRRGDQLWTNDGAYKPPASGQEYPPDLDSYPEHGEGWMNEQGVRIDMAHRLIPKAPLKSALKTSRPQPTPVQQGN